MSVLNDLIKEIDTTRSQVSASAKHEERVMRAMLNDREYKVGVYGKNGLEGEYCPAADARTMLSTIIQSTTKVSAEEATKLAETHEFKKSEAQSMINISKEYVNVYIQTGRKLPLGGRETSDITLS